jgi:hypothetical protein
MRVPDLLYPFLLIGIFTACGPHGPLPGGRLEGEQTSAPARDWSFTDAYWTIQLETRPDDPYSVTVWCVAADGNLYVGAGQGASSVWARALMGDDRARVLIGEAIYEVSATVVADPAEILIYLDALSKKHGGSDAALSDFQSESDQPPTAILFRLEPRSSSDAALEGVEADVAPSMTSIQRRVSQIRWAGRGIA